MVYDKAMGGAATSAVITGYRQYVISLSQSYHMGNLRNLRPNLEFEYFNDTTGSNICKLI